MIEYISGSLYSNKDNVIVIDNKGIGYKIYITKSLASSLPVLGANVTVYTHLIHKETAMELYGFYDSYEKDIFEELIKVQGVGSKLALKILSGMPSNDVVRYVLSKDAKSLSDKVSGLGKKTADKIIIELSSKFIKLYQNDAVGYTLDDSSSKTTLAFEALIALGYKDSEVKRALISSIKDEEESRQTEDIVKEALIWFSKN